MSEFGQQINFRQLLERHGRVQVPMIQRDYAQGRESEAEVREEFLNTLYTALTLPKNDGKLPLNLDFIYGDVVGNGSTRFRPLDGQQRLTTLFLLHWYLAWQDGRLGEFEQLFCPDCHSRFSYSVRPSSTEFYDELAAFQPDCSPESVESLSQLVTNQPWYFRYWRLDPTIQSSLRMLDAIHQHFRGATGLYERIIDIERPAITFQLLNLENFGLSDDLYIKMNARGKPLTSFETFKARYEQDLASQFEGEVRSIGTEEFAVAEYFSRRMDTAWADFFWGHRNRETNLYDDAVMNFFRAVVLATRDPESESYIKEASELRNRLFRTTYSFFHTQEWLDRDFSETLILLLEAWSRNGKDFSSQLPDARFFDDAKFFEDAACEPTELGYTQIVQFVGYVTFIREHKNEVDSDAFQEWMRVVFNLSVNTSYDRPADMQRSVSGLFKMAPYSGDILRFFANSEKPTAGFSPQQVAEEKMKAELILADAGWRPLIESAEEHEYFKGQIEFLLDFCGAMEMWETGNCANWDSETHSALQEKFRSYLEKASTMFTAHGLRNLGNYRWERALLSIGDYLLPSGRNYSFLVNSSTEQASWKRLLRGTGLKVPEARKMLRQLLDRLTLGDALSEQLDKIIAEATGLEPWREALVRTPEAISYCEKKAIRWNSETNIYLLSKTQMNGAHAELFTFCLYHNSLKQMAEKGGLQPFSSIEYLSVSDTDLEPGIRLIFKRQSHTANFEVEFSRGEFLVYLERQSAGWWPEIVDPLRTVAGFTGEADLLSKRASPANIEASLQSLAKDLTTIFP